MRIRRGFVKFFLFLFIILILGTIVSLSLGKYQTWIGYTLIGFLIFLVLLSINKRYPKTGKFLIFVFIIAIVIFVLFQNFDFKSIFINSSDVKFANVTKIISGNKFEIGENNTGVLACVIVPESGEEGFRESRNFLRELIFDRSVKLEKVDIKSNSSGDEYYYAYVDLEGVEVSVNREVIVNGFGNYINDSSGNICDAIIA